MQKLMTLAVGGLLLVTGSLASADVAGESPYLRVVTPDDQTARLEVALRRFTPGEGAAGATVWLTGAIHLADERYYRALQDHLDERDLVLYEGVGHPAFLDDLEAGAGEGARFGRTMRRMEFMGMMVRWHHERFGEYPESLADLRRAARAERRTEALWLAEAASDAWGNAIEYRRDGDGFTITTLGADGKPGGSGFDAEATLDAARSPDPPALEPPLQAKLADALGLRFQLGAIDYGRAHFRNSDMSMEQVRAAIARRGHRPAPPARDRVGRPLAGQPDADEARPARAGDGNAPAQREFDRVLNLMGGGSSMAPLLNFATRAVGASGELRAIVKLVMIEMLGQIEGDMSRMQGLSPAMADLMAVLIRDRNRVVIDDLERVLSGEDTPDSIGIFYGAGHMPDLEARLVERLGYEPAETVWLEAFSADLRQTRLTPAQIERVRAMITAQMRLLQRGR